MNDLIEVVRAAVVAKGYELVPSKDAHVLVVKPLDPTPSASKYTITFED